MFLSILLFLLKELSKINYKGIKEKYLLFNILSKHEAFYSASPLPWKPFRTYLCSGLLCFIMPLGYTAFLHP